MPTVSHKRRFGQLKEAALNLGMNDKDASFYAAEALAHETAVQDN